MGENFGKLMSSLLLISLIASTIMFSCGVKGVENGLEDDDILFLDTSYGNCTWIMEQEITFKIGINASLVDVNRSNFQYSFKTTGPFISEPYWIPVHHIEENGSHVDILVNISLRNGTSNWIIFRENISDPNGTVSPAYNLWHDGQAPFINYRGNLGDDWLLDTEQSLLFYMNDTLSGIDRERLEYRIKNHGSPNWTQWSNISGKWDVEKNQVRMNITFARGDQNYVQARCWDILGNGPTTSREVNVKVNTFPIINLSSPLPGDNLTCDEEILFDASGSYDPDGDRISITWYYSSNEHPELFGDVVTVERLFEEGNYTICIICKDRVNNEVQYIFNISVMGSSIPEVDLWEIDSDGDGLPDGWEILWQLDPVKNDAHEDPDRDGFTNLQEYENDTNPRNSIGPGWRFEEPKNEEETEFPWYLIVIIGLLISLTLVGLNIFVFIRNKKKRSLSEE